MVVQKRIIFKIIILWLVIIFLASFSTSLRANSDPISIQVIPQVPRENESIIATFSINNPSDEKNRIDYSFYANGKDIMSGNVVLDPGTGRQFQYIYNNPFKIGDQVTFHATTRSNNLVSEKSLQFPSYAPQIWSSFVSFASFSSTMMSSMSMSSMTYYDDSFGTNRALNSGLIFSIVLILLLIFLELSEPLLAEKSIPVIGRLRIRFTRLTAVLFIIFVGMVFTQVALIIGGV
ncbi:MAG: hypothetical protein FIB07_04335 [Candidatus Methanoperedens sp.]|nr:hypothetical protein [Candidatus Methanoperedens sp.]